MALKGRPNSRPRVGDSEVGDRGRPSSCVLDPFQKGQLIRERFLLKVFCWAGSAGRHISHMNAISLQKSYNSNNSLPCDGKFTHQHFDCAAILKFPTGFRNNLDIACIRKKTSNVASSKTAARGFYFRFTFRSIGDVRLSCVDMEDYGYPVLAKC